MNSGTTYADRPKVKTEPVKAVPAKAVVVKAVLPEAAPGNARPVKKSAPFTEGAIADMKKVSAPASSSKKSQKKVG